MLQPTNPGSFAWVRLIYSRRGGSTAIVLVLDTVDESRDTTADRMTKSPVPRCSRDGELYYDRRLDDCLLFGLDSVFSSFSPSLSLYVSRRIASSVQRTSALHRQVRVPLVLSLIHI